MKILNISNLEYEKIKIPHFQNTISRSISSHRISLPRRVLPILHRFKSSLRKPAHRLQLKRTQFNPMKIRRVFAEFSCSEYKRHDLRDVACSRRHPDHSRWTRTLAFGSRARAHKSGRDLAIASVPSPRPTASIKSTVATVKKSPAIFGHWTHRPRYHLRYSWGVSPRNECHCFRTLSIFFGMDVAPVLSIVLLPSFDSPFFATPFLLHLLRSQDTAARRDPRGGNGYTIHFFKPPFARFASSWTWMYFRGNCAFWILNGEKWWFVWRGCFITSLCYRTGTWWTSYDG